MVSTPGKRTNGNTGLFTKTPDTSRSFVMPRSARVRPAITFAATLASEIPAAFERYGTVRDARGFTSSTYTTSSFVAYCTFMRPTTFNARARLRVYLRLVPGCRRGKG